MAGRTIEMPQQTPSTTSTRQKIPRRKACDHCVMAKRRCDGRQPCTTCARKRISCSLFAASIVCSTTDLAITPSESCNILSHEQGEITDSWSFPSDQSFLTDLNETSDSQYHRPTMNYILPPFTLVQLAPFRLQKCIQKLRDCIKSMAQDGGTPFFKFCSEASVAETSVFLACTAYQSRTKHNRAVLHRALSQQFLSLVRNLKRTVSFREHLGILHSLIVFQIMFYFGDDDVLRILAEDHSESIQRSVGLFQQSLVSETVFPTLCESVVDDNSAPYRWWLLLESARRMILAHLFVKGMYGHLRNGYCDIVPLLAELPLSIEGDLWEADTEDDWMRSLKSRPRVLESSVMPYGEAVTFWLVNDCPNMDDFHHLIYEACHDLKPASVES